MSNLDALLLAAQLLSANHTAADHLVNAALYYGPGILLTALTATAWRAYQRALRRYHRWANDRAERRHQAATVLRINTVADNTDRIIAQAGQHLADQLLHQINTHDTEGDR